MNFAKIFQLIVIFFWALTSCLHAFCVDSIAEYIVASAIINSFHIEWLTQIINRCFFQVFQWILIRIPIICDVFSPFFDHNLHFDSVCLYTF